MTVHRGVDRRLSGRMLVGLGVFFGIAIALIDPWGPPGLGEVDLTPYPTSAPRDSGGGVEPLRSAIPVASHSIRGSPALSAQLPPSSAAASSSAASRQSDPNAELIDGALIAARGLLMSEDLATALVEARATCDSVPLDPVTAKALSDVCVRWVAAAVYNEELETVATKAAESSDKRDQKDSLSRRRFLRQTALSLAPDLPHLVLSGRVKTTAGRIAGHSGKSPLAHSSSVWGDDGIRFVAQHSDYWVALDVPSREMVAPLKDEFARHRSTLSRSHKKPDQHKER